MLELPDVSGLGRVLDSAVIQTGLKDLNRDFAFDVAVNRPADYGNVVQFRDPQALEAMRLNRLPVMYGDRYIVGMDRGMVTEFKQWSVKEVVTEIDWADADKDGLMPSIQQLPVFPTEPDYFDLWDKALHGGDPGLAILPGGRLVRRKAMGYTKVRGRVIRLGWRHTLERIINAQIPGATRQAIADKFSVDMMKYPVGSPEELIATLVEE